MSAFGHKRTLELVGIRVGFFDLVHGAVGVEMQRDREFVFATVVNPLIIQLNGQIRRVVNITKGYVE